MPQGLGWNPARDLSERVCDRATKLTPAFRAGGQVAAWRLPLPAWSQGNTNTCAGHAGAAAATCARWRKTKRVEPFSPRFSYRTAQWEGGFAAPGTFNGPDEGTSIESVIAASIKYGQAPWAVCPFDAGKLYEPISSDAFGAALHNQHLGQSIDLRDWDDAIAWLTDRRSIVIGTIWTTGQDHVRGQIEDRDEIRRGQKRGYHARCVCGLTDEGLPLVLNSHGPMFGVDGRTALTKDGWDYLFADRFAVALGFCDIEEGDQPQRTKWDSVVYV